MATYTVDLPDDVVRTIKTMARQAGKPETEIMRQAIGFFSYIKKEVNEDRGDELVIMNRTQNIVKKVPILK
jgi:predicted transcriptional regulator